MDTLAIPKNVHMFNDNDVCAHCQITRSNASELCQPICWTRVARDRVDEVLRFELREWIQDGLVQWLPDTIRAFEEFSAPHTDEIVRIIPVTYGAHGEPAKLIRFIDQTVVKIVGDRHLDRRNGSHLYLVWRARPEVYPRMDDRTGKDTGDWCFRMRLGAAWGPEGIVPRADPPKAPPTGELAGLGREMMDFMRGNLSAWYAVNAHRVSGFAKHSLGEQCIIVDPNDPCDTYHLRETVLSTVQASPVAAVEALRLKLRKAIRTAIEGMTDSHHLVVAEKGPATYEMGVDGQVTGKHTVIVQAIPASFAPRRTMFYEPHRRKCCGTELTTMHALGCTSPGAIKRACCDSFVDQKHSTACSNVNGFKDADIETDELRARGEARKQALLESFKITSKEARENAAAAVFEAGMPSFGLAPVKNEGPAFNPYDHVKLMAHQQRIARNNPPKPVDERPAEAIAAAFALPVPGAITVRDLCATPMPHMLEPSK